MNPDEPPSPRLRIAFIGGGSGGHLFPAIAVAEEILRTRPGSQFLFLTSSRPVDAQVLATAQWPQGTLQVLPYVSMAKNERFLNSLMIAPELLNSYRGASKALREFQPQLAIGVGAWASVPGSLAASRMKIPLALMEQNTLPGKANRFLSGRAKVTLAGMPFIADAALRWKSPLTVTGTAVRAQISSLATLPPDRTADRPRLLILGGSQGSASVNRLVLEAFADEHCVPSDWQIIHQTGETQVKQVSDEYARRGRTATVLSFLPNLPELLSKATLVISRAGAGTLQELACAGLTSILIPFRHAAANHQLANARLLAADGAAALVEETDADAGIQLRHLLNDFVSNPDLRHRCARNIREFARPDAASVSARILLSLVEPGNIVTAKV